MAITTVERARRSEMAELARCLDQVEVDSRQQIRDAALAEFTKRLDGKIANLQDGERLVIFCAIDIVRSNGEVRGGSGAQRNMPEYIAWRTAVFERDGYTCQECGAKGKLNAHHIRHWQSFRDGRFDVDNGITLCPKCHAAKHPHLRLVDSG